MREFTEIYVIIMKDFKDCEYRYMEDDVLYCENKLNKDNRCDNCKNNIHLTCQNYVAKNDMCLQFFELGISDVSQYDECAEKIIYDDKDLQRKWSN